MELKLNTQTQTQTQTHYSKLTKPKRFGFGACLLESCWRYKRGPICSFGFSCYATFLEKHRLKNTSCLPQSRVKWVETTNVTCLLLEMIWMSVNISLGYIFSRLTLEKIFERTKYIEKRPTRSIDIVNHCMNYTGYKWQILPRYLNEMWNAQISTEANHSYRALFEQFSHLFVFSLEQNRIAKYCASRMNGAYPCP